MLCPAQVSVAARVWENKSLFDLAIGVAGSTYSFKLQIWGLWQLRFVPENAQLQSSSGFSPLLFLGESP